MCYKPYDMTPNSAVVEPRRAYPTASHLLVEEAVMSRRIQDYVAFYDI
jgi:hypothetical protein